MSEERKKLIEDLIDFIHLTERYVEATSRYNDITAVAKMNERLTKFVRYLRRELAKRGIVVE